MLNEQKIWQDFHNRHQNGAQDPDSPLCDVILPSPLAVDAACALTEIYPNESTISFPEKTSLWLNQLAQDNQQAYTLISLICAKKAAPSLAFWKQTHKNSGFIINLASFVTSDGQFSLDHFTQHISFIVKILENYIKSQSHHSINDYALYLTNMDLFLAKLGYLYDSEEGHLSACITVTISKYIAQDRSYFNGSFLKGKTLPKGIYALRALLNNLKTLHFPQKNRQCPTLRISFTTPNPIDRMLSVESCGYQPYFSLTREDETLSWATIYRLAAHGYTPQSALASVFNGSLYITPNDKQDAQRMYKSLATTSIDMPPPPMNEKEEQQHVRQELLKKRSKHKKFLRLVS